jgi:hypothetical protein
MRSGTLSPVSGPHRFYVGFMSGDNGGEGHCDIGSKTVVELGSVLEVLGES